MCSISRSANPRARGEPSGRLCGEATGRPDEDECVRGHVETERTYAPKWMCALRRAHALTFSHTRAT
eukprot:10225305-Alexandrium_andersonii.AAC.1